MWQQHMNSLVAFCPLSQGSKAPSDPAGFEPSTHAGQEKTRASPLHFMMFPLDCTRTGGRPPSFRTLMWGCTPTLEGPVDPCTQPTSSYWHYWHSSACCCRMRVASCKHSEWAGFANTCTGCTGACGFAEFRLRCHSLCRDLAERLEPCQSLCKVPCLRM